MIIYHSFSNHLSATAKTILLSFFLFIVFTSAHAQPSLDEIKADYSFIKETILPDSTKEVTGGVIDCNMSIPQGHYILAESFFENFDYVVRRVAFLKAYGFDHASYIHSSCQSFDIDKELYVVVISKPVLDKKLLYKATELAYQHAVKKDIKLINTRIIYCHE